MQPVTAAPIAAIVMLNTAHYAVPTQATSISIFNIQRRFWPFYLNDSFF